MSWEDPATAGQRHSITMLALYRGIKEPIEDQEMNRAQARDLIYRLRKKEKK